MIISNVIHTCTAFKMNSGSRIKINGKPEEQTNFFSGICMKI